MKWKFILGNENKSFVVYLAWIASKGKEVASVLPSGEATTAIPTVNNQLPKVSGGSMGMPSGDKPAARRRGRKKTTTPSTNDIAAGKTPASNDDEAELSNGEEASKRAIKRVIRALINRQLINIK